MSLSFKTLSDTVTFDDERRVVVYAGGEIPFASIPAVEVSYSPAGSYSAESYPVHLAVREGSKIEITNDAFGAARQAAVAAAGALDVPIHDLSFGTLSTTSAKDWSLPLRERSRGIVGVPSLDSPGDDLRCERLEGGLRFRQKPGGFGRTWRQVRREAGTWDSRDWGYAALVGVCFLIPFLILIPVALAVYAATQIVLGRPLRAILTVSPSEVRLGGGITEPDPIAAEDVRDVGLFRQRAWRDRIRVRHLVVRSDDARLEFPVMDEAEGEWLRQHVLAALTRR